MDTSFRSHKRRSTLWDKNPVLRTDSVSQSQAPFQLKDIKDYTKGQWSDQNLTLSKERLLLQVNSPDSYTIYYSGTDSHHLRIKSMSRKLSFSKSRLSLTGSVSSFSLIVNLKFRTKKQQIDIYHIDE